MTYARGLLEKAYAQVTQMPNSEQDAIANLILEVLADEEQSAEQFANSQDALAIGTRSDGRTQRWTDTAA